MVCQSELELQFYIYKAKLPWTYENTDLTVDQVKLDLQEKYSIPGTLFLIINNQGCDNNKTIQWYRRQYPNRKFRATFSSQTPRQRAYNIYTIQKLIGQPRLYNECKLCSNKPNVAIASCEHEPALCLTCVRQITKCYVCHNHISELETLL